MRGVRGIVIGGTLALIAAFPIGCSIGRIGDADENRPTGPGTTASACNGIDPGPSPIRRLTRFEYDNTVRDLLGDTTHPARDFPAEEESHGFSNDAVVLGVTPVLAEQYQAAAERLANNAKPMLGTIIGCDPNVTGVEACASHFIRTFGRRAFRRPLDGDEVKDFLAVHAAGMEQGKSFAEGARFVIEAMLQSPAFLYRVELSGLNATAPLSHWEIASRLSYLLWGSMPDDALLDAADRGQLGTEEQVAAEALRMSKDPRAKQMVAHFHDEWLELAKLGPVLKAPDVYPEFGEPLKNDMRKETELFIEQAFWKEGSLDALLTSSTTFVSAPLAQLYGIDTSMMPVSGFVRVTLDAKRRAGFLTQPSFLTLNAKANQTSPIHRGKFVRERLLCDTLPPPPNDVMIVAPEVKPGTATRDRFKEHSINPRCASCHRLMDPIGFAFEHYDGIGKWRDLDNGKAVDALGEIVATTDVDGKFDGAIELAHKLANSEQVRACVVTQWFRYGYGRLESERDRCTIEKLNKRFAASHYDMRELLIGLVVSDAFRYRGPGKAGAP